MNKEKEDKLFIGIKWYVLFCIFFWALAGLFYYAEGEQLYYRRSPYSIEEKNGDSIVGEMVKGVNIEQTFQANVEELEKIGIMFSDYGRSNVNSIQVNVQNIDTQEILLEDIVSGENVGTNAYYYFDVTKPARVKGNQIKISITGLEGEGQKSSTVVYNSQYQLENGDLFINGVETPGTLCFSMLGRDSVWTGNHYWKIMITIFVIFTIIYIWYSLGVLRGKKRIIADFIFVIRRYGFLMSQLVIRDFKVKYKKSVLGILWSFLNPLLTMSIQYIVFSQLFKTDIKYYPVYLLSGVVMFSFFSEAVVNSLVAIVGNAPLITKVYVPKYIYPVAKVLSSEINLMISLIPLFIMMLFTVKRVTKAIILLPIPLLCLTIFAMGIGLILCTCMVFFRDVQFLWGIFSMVWMYSTPLFYPENILPESFKFIHTINPLYYFIKMFRIIIIDGMAPEPKLVFVSVCMALGAFLVGTFVFKKNQDKFILYI